MTTPDESASVVLAVAASKLKDKAHFARAAEKYEAAVAALAAELAADDCLVLAFLRSRQAYCFSCHSVTPTLSDAERIEMLGRACALHKSSISTLRRRKEAGTLLPGSCRAAEVAWYRAFVLQVCLRDGASADEARAHADAFAGAVGTETYICAANASNSMVIVTKGDLQNWFAAFLASGVDLLASQPDTAMSQSGIESFQESTLAISVQRTLKDEALMRRLSDAAATLLTDAWRRLERSGVLERRLMGRASQPVDPADTLNARMEATAKEGAARGLQTCALAGCAAREVHVSHFKKCGACKTVAYCCKEHQVADWPAHKAACKAARKAAAPGNDA